MSDEALGVRVPFYSPSRCVEISVAKAVSDAVELKRSCGFESRHLYYRRKDELICLTQDGEHKVMYTSLRVYMVSLNARDACVTAQQASLGCLRV